MHVVFSEIKWQYVKLNLVKKEYSYRAGGPPPKPKPTPTPTRDGRTAARAWGILSLPEPFTPI